jgi:hypothetical protein
MIRIGVRPEMKGGLAFSLFYTYRDRIVADGGYVEAFSCAIYRMNSL